MNLADTKMESGYSLQEEMHLQALEQTSTNMTNLMKNPHVTQALRHSRKLIRVIILI